MQIALNNVNPDKYFELLYGAKLIFSYIFLIFNEVGVLLRNMFVSMVSLRVFEKCFKKFNEKFLYFNSAFRDHVCNLNIPYFGHDYREFINKL